MARKFSQELSVQLRFASIEYIYKHILYKHTHIYIYTRIYTSKKYIIYIYIIDTLFKKKKKTISGARNQSPHLGYLRGENCWRLRGWSEMAPKSGAGGMCFGANNTCTIVQKVLNSLSAQNTRSRVKGVWDTFNIL